MEEKLEQLLLLKHPSLKPKQNPEVIEQNMQIMLKQIDEKKVKEFSKLEYEITGKNDISDLMTLKKAEPVDKSLENKKIEPIWDLMVFGIDTGDGWFNLIDVLFTELEKITKGGILHVDQVKEKYGELTIYLNTDNELAFKLVSNAEKISREICENCGRPGKTYDDGWVVTLCPKCRIEYKNRKMKEKLAPYNEQYSRKKILTGLYKGTKNK